VHNESGDLPLVILHKIDLNICHLQKKARLRLGKDRCLTLMIHLSEQLIPLDCKGETARRAQFVDPGIFQKS